MIWRRSPMPFWSPWTAYRWGKLPLGGSYIRLVLGLVVEKWWKRSMNCAGRSLEHKNPGKNRGFNPRKKRVNFSFWRNGSWQLCKLGLGRVHKNVGLTMLDCGSGPSDSESQVFFFSTKMLMIALSCLNFPSRDSNLEFGWPARRLQMQWPVWRKWLKLYHLASLAEQVLKVGYIQGKSNL